MSGLYTIGDAAAKLGMPASTIRFYEKNGLIPNQQRSSDGRRLFDEDDLEWMRFVERLKVSGMPISCIDSIRVVAGLKSYPKSSPLLAITRLYQ